jgi:hypothetical protein
MRLPQSQNRNLNNMCIVGNLVSMISKHESVKSRAEPIVCRVGCLFPYHVIGASVRTDPPSFTWLVVCLTKVLSVI